jgi:hypothetical protein
MKAPRPFLARRKRILRGQLRMPVLRLMDAPRSVQVVHKKISFLMMRRTSVTLSS